MGRCKIISYGIFASVQQRFCMNKYWYDYNTIGFRVCFFSIALDQVTRKKKATSFSFVFL